MFGCDAEALNEPLGDEGTVTRFGVAFDAQQRGIAGGGEVGEHRREIGVAQNLCGVAASVVRGQCAARALADALTVVLGVLELTQFCGGGKLAVVPVVDPSLVESGLQSERVGPRIVGAADRRAGLCQRDPAAVQP
ncbi:hypothetical protein JOF34_000645 [Microbacterium amylolyticum]|uniref:Uncharacterized protein n=1 Tax=Microbacterium amylolyticum TaxID=936337 RepID=A0ABS4ZFL8_9MICO|nr:hypothetical protein [Microbacterium amylolyticum]MBP2436059.1 hypothetical protein [Microbacterium amylolyticum]